MCKCIMHKVNQNPVNQCVQINNKDYAEIDDKLPNKLKHILVQ